MWRAQVPELAETFRVAAYDHRGHGASPVPPGPYTIDDLGAESAIALLDTLGAERAHFCGLSVGGILGMWLGVNHPDRVERLVLCCCFARNVPDAPWDERIATVRAGGVGAVADGVAGRWLTPEFADRQPQTYEWVRTMLASQPPDGYMAACAAVRDADLLDDLGAIRAPTLVIGGAQDAAARGARGDRRGDPRRAPGDALTRRAPRERRAAGRGHAAHPGASGRLRRTTLGR